MFEILSQLYIIHVYGYHDLGTILSKIMIEMKSKSANK